MRKDLYSKETAKQYYENRYEKGYMEDWPVEKKQRVFEVIQQLPLPSTGVALDFGCGNGVFTDVLRQALPSWKIFGCDISVHSIENAKERCPDCTFFVSDNENVSRHKFDFIFSHHVLEHVFDIEKTTEEIAALLKEQSSMLHILPCGNKGSFEYELCTLTKDGIDAGMENRFFFEEEGHLRRLDTDRTCKLFGKHRFFLKSAFYANQYYGAVKWITQSLSNEVKTIIQPARAIDKNASSRLRKIRIKFMALFILQFPAVAYVKSLRSGAKRAIHYFILVFGAIPALLSYPVYSWVSGRANAEWKRNRKLKNGSEMYLFFSR